MEPNFNALGIILASDKEINSDWKNAFVDRDCRKMLKIFSINIKQRLIILLINILKRIIFYLNNFI